MARQKPSEAFVERSERQPRSKRISLRVGDDGQIDWSQVPEKTRALYKETVKNDTVTLEAIAESEPNAPNPLAVTPEHMAAFLDGLAWVERQAAYRIVDKKTRQPWISKEVADQVYRFSPQHHAMLDASGAEAANEALPEWLRRWILDAGPLTRFLGAFSLITISQTRAAIDLTKKQRAFPGQPSPASETQPVNGHAKPVTGTAEDGSTFATNENEILDAIGKRNEEYEN